LAHKPYQLIDGPLETIVTHPWHIIFIELLRFLCQSSKFPASFHNKNLYFGVIFYYKSQYISICWLELELARILWQTSKKIAIFTFSETAVIVKFNLGALTDLCDFNQRESCFGVLSLCATRYIYAFLPCGTLRVVTS
jgi:hypothetical protein